MGYHTDGYILFHRRIFNSWQGQNPKTFFAWMWIISNANYADDVPLKGLKRGQLYFSAKDAAKEWKTNKMWVYRFLNRAETEGDILRTKRNKMKQKKITKKVNFNVVTMLQQCYNNVTNSDVITIVNYDKYQALDSNNVTTMLQQCYNNVTTTSPKAPIYAVSEPPKLINKKNKKITNTGAGSSTSTSTSTKPESGTSTNSQSSTSMSTSTKPKSSTSTGSESSTVLQSSTNKKIKEKEGPFLPSEETGSFLPKEETRKKNSTRLGTSTNNTPLSPLKGGFRYSSDASHPADSGFLRDNLEMFSSQNHETNSSLETKNNDHEQTKNRNSVKKTKTKITAAARGKRRNKKTETPDPRVKQLIDYFYDRFQEKFGSKYVVTVKDAAQIKRLLGTLEEDDIRDRIDRYLSDQDSFVEKQGYSITFFASRVNAYMKNETDVDLQCSKIIDYFTSKYKKVFKVNYLVTPEDKRKLSQVVKTLSEDDFKTRIDSYLKDGDPFLEKNGFSLSLFIQRINVYSPRSRYDPEFEGWGPPLELEK